MDLLTPVRGRRWPWSLLLAWLAVTACLSLPSGRRAEPSFPHRVHVVDNGLSCGFCHPGAAVAERPGMPPPELCAPCHDAIDANKPPELRVAAFYDGGSYRTVASSGLTADVKFSHQRHVTGGQLACDACHAAVATADFVPLQPIARKDDCMSCHQRYGMVNACAECHLEIDQTWLPPSHQRNWVRAHGDLMIAGSDRSADRCSLCHQDSTSCLSCHQQMAPASHNQTFRTRTHGLAASVDRSRCMVCHTQDSCQHCHEFQRPLSHRGGFGSPQQRHCTSCHFPLADNGCYVCHKSAAAHDQATPLPPDHSPAMNCRLCHGNGVPLRHPDGGHTCTACHR